MRFRLIVAFIACALLLPVQAEGRTRATLRVVVSTPLTVRGAHFRPRESVRLSIVMGTRTLSRQLRAGRLGGFTVQFVGVRLERCTIPLVITARGAVTGLVRAFLLPVDCAQP